MVHPLTIKRVLVVSCVLFGLLTMTSALQSQTLEWEQRYNGSALDPDETFKVVVDAAENVYVTGYSWSAASGDDYITIKYNTEGTEEWVALYNGPGNAEDRAADIAVDPLGNVYVTGRSMNAAGDFDYATVKYNPVGTEVWVNRYDGAGNAWDEACAIVLDDTIFVFVTGWSVGAGTNYDYVTHQYSSSGALNWTAVHNGPVGTGADYASDIELDAFGRAVVTGRSYSGAGMGYDFATVKYDLVGGLIWEHRYDNPLVNGDDEAVALVVDPGGPIFVTGRSDGGITNFDYALIKLTGGGGLLWVTRFDGAANGYDEPRDLALDSAGDVIVTGESAGIGPDYATVKYNSMGALQWVMQYNDPANSFDGATALALDSGDNIYVTGYSDVGALNTNFTTIKYDPAGVVVWTTSYDYAGYGEDALDIAVDGEENVYLTGRSNSDSINVDSQTLKYNQGAIPYISVEHIPVSYPVTVPLAGGSFDYTVTLSNNTAIAQSFEYWVMARLPSNIWVGPLIGPFTLTLPPNYSATRLRAQTVPGGAPTGIYMYEGRVGTFPGTVVDRSNFPFEKLPVSDGYTGNSYEAWEVSGDSWFIEEKLNSAQPSHYSFNAPHPNPFNPETVLSFNLPEAARVLLQVYDTSGSLVAELIDGWREAGTHDLRFDATRMPSGLYLASFRTGDFQETQKLLLIK